MPDSQPNYLTIDPATGAVGAAFTGVVHATGLDLATYTGGGSTPAVNKVRWVRASDGAETGYIAMVNPGGTDANQKVAYLWMADTILQLVQTGTTSAEISGYVGAAPNAQFWKMAAQNGYSDFFTRGGSGVYSGGNWRIGNFTGPYNGGAGSDKTAFNLPPGNYAIGMQGSLYGPSVNLFGIDVYLNGTLWITNNMVMNAANFHTTIGMQWIAPYVHSGGNLLVQLRNGSPAGIASISDTNDRASMIIAPASTGNNTVIQ